MLRALIWIEFCSTWWWWFLILLPFAITRQITSIPVGDIAILWLMPIIVGLGIASGMRDRQGIRDALNRHGNPWRILLAKLMVPGVLLPTYFCIGQMISREITHTEADLGSMYDWSLSNNIAFLAPLFLAGLATGLRQAHWWGTRLAPIGAMVVLTTLIGALIPWTWMWEWMDTVTWTMDRSRWYLLILAVGHAALLSMLGIWWCLAALREAGGEDGPSSRRAGACVVGITALGLVMPPWIYINERWEQLLDHQIVAAPKSRYSIYKKPVFIDLSLSRLYASQPGTWYGAIGKSTLYDTPLPGRGVITTYFNQDKRNNEVALDTKNAQKTNPIVIIQGTGDTDGKTTLTEAWRRLNLSLSSTMITDRWHNLRLGLTGGWGHCGRAAQGRNPFRFWNLTDDPGRVRSNVGDPKPARLFQLDSWSGPDLIIRPLTAADPPFLRLWENLRVGIWEDRLTWDDAHGAPVTIPHPFTKDMPAAIDVRGETEPIIITYHWRPSPWSALRWQITVIDRDGTVLSRSDLPTAESHPLMQGLGLLGSPVLASIGLAINRSEAENPTRPWASLLVLPWTVAGGLLASGLTWWILAWRGVSRRSRWSWIVAAMLGGIAVPIAAVAVWFPAPRRNCPSCGHRRWADDIACPKCHAAWGTPPVDDRQLSDVKHTSDSLKAADISLISPK